MDQPTRVPARSFVATAPEELQASLFVDRPPQGPTGRLWVGGDVAFSGRLRDLARETPGPLEEVLATAANQDLWFANLETTFLPEASHADLFASPAKAVEALERPGRWILSVANNHVRDYGGDGLAHTLKNLRSHGMEAVGAGRDDDAARRLVTTPLHPRRSNSPETSGAAPLRLGFLACARTLQEQAGEGPRFWELDQEELLAAVRQARPQVDLLVVSLHMGYMYVDYPHPDHRRLAFAVAEAGADLVLGHHAHVLQGVEVTATGSTICHGLGNLLFDWTEGEVPVDLQVEEQRSGAAFVFDLDRQGICRAAALPFRMGDDLRLGWATGAKGTAILDRLETISDDLTSGQFETEFRRQRAQRNTGLTLKTLGRQLGQGNVAVLWDAARRVRPHHLPMATRWLLGRFQGRFRGRSRGAS